MVNDVFVSKTSYTSLVLSHVTPVYVFIARNERRNSAISNSEKRRQMKAVLDEGGKANPKARNMAEMAVLYGKW